MCNGKGVLKKQNELKSQYSCKNLPILKSDKFLSIFMETKFLYIKGRFLFNPVIDFNFLYSLQVCIFIYHNCLLFFF